MKKKTPDIIIDIDLDLEKVQRLKELMKEKGVRSKEDLERLAKKTEEENNPSQLTH